MDIATLNTGEEEHLFPPVKSGVQGGQQLGGCHHHRQLGKPAQQQNGHGVHKIAEKHLGGGNGKAQHGVTRLSRATAMGTYQGVHHQNQGRRGGKAERPVRKHIRCAVAFREDLGYPHSNPQLDHGHSRQNDQHPPKGGGDGKIEKGTSFSHGTSSFHRVSMRAMVWLRVRPMARIFSIYSKVWVLGSCCCMA